MDIDALIPLQIRLQSLEAQINGVPRSHDDGQTQSTRGKSDGRGSIVRQMRATQETLERISQESEALKRLLSGCELPSFPSCAADDRRGVQAVSESAG